MKKKLKSAGAAFEYIREKLGGVTEEIASPMREGMKYPKIIAALRDHNSGQWRIGDLLVEECGPPPGKGGTRSEEGKASTKKMREIAIEAFENGIEIQIKYLHRLRRTSYKWRNHDDVASRPFFEHAYHAGDPETYERVAALAKQQGKPLTVEFIDKALTKNPPNPPPKPDPAKRLTSVLNKTAKVSNAALNAAKAIRYPLDASTKRSCMGSIDRARGKLDAVERIIVGEKEVIEGHKDTRTRGQYHAEKRANNKRKHLRVVEGGHDVG